MNEINKKIKEEYSESDMLKLRLYKELPDIQCRKGWYPLLRELNRKITEIEEKYEVNEIVKASQVKEKFGELRIYAMIFCTSIDSETLEKINNEVDEEVSKAEKASRSICEICSSYGEIINESNILMCRCPSCK